jgi:hypothetical protein
MIDRVVGNKLLPANVRQDIIERTDGIPLFVEEMTKAVLEAQSQGAAEHLAATVPSSALAVPASLQASLMAGSTVLAQRKRWHRSGQRSDGSFRTPCSRRWCASRRRSWDRRCTALPRPDCCSGRAYRRTRPICSSTRWCRTQPTARCCASRDARFTPASQRPSKASSRTSSRASPSCWPDTAPRQA